MQQRHKKYPFYPRLGSRQHAIIGQLQPQYVIQQEDQPNDQQQTQRPHNAVAQALC